MRAISAAKLDSLADYAEIAIAAPKPGPGQVRIRVAAVGIGYVDALVALGRYQVKPPLPHIPGSEIAGTIDAIVADRGRLQPGETLLVLGAAGGVGSATIQVGKALGASSQPRRRRKSVHLHCNTVPVARSAQVAARRRYAERHSRNVFDNAAMESFFSSLKTERVARKISRTRNHAKAEVFDYIERFYNPTRRHSTLSYLSPMDFETQAVVA